jgi:TonB family protein
MSIENPEAKPPPALEPGQQGAAEPPLSGPAGAPAPSAAPVIVGAIMVAVLVICGYVAWQNRALFTASHGPGAYAVQPYAPPSQLISAHDHVLAYTQPDTSSTQVVMFGPGVALAVNGRVSRGFGNDWYAITWNGQTAFVRASDAVPGQATAPPPTAPHVAPLPPRIVKPPAEAEDALRSDVSAPPMITGPFELTNPRWIRRPSSRDVARYYPRRALDDSRSGRVVLDCVANSNGRLDCSVASEEPQGYQFGQAALSIARGMRIAPTLPDGRSVAGGHVRVPLSFRAD